MVFYTQNVKHIIYIVISGLMVGLNISARSREQITNHARGLHLSNYICHDISVYVNKLARYSTSPTQRHWNIVKYILRYLMGITNMSLFYSKVSKHVTCLLVVVQLFHGDL